MIVSGWLSQMSCCLCLILCFLAAVYDLDEMQIPNWITYPGILAGAVITFVAEEHLLMKLLMFLFLFLIGSFLFGEGDVKLCMMAVMLSGPVQFLISFITSQLLILVAQIIADPSKVRIAFQKLFHGDFESMARWMVQTEAIPLAPAFFLGYGIVLVCGTIL